MNHPSQKDKLNKRYMLIGLFSTIFVAFSSYRNFQIHVVQANEPKLMPLWLLAFASDKSDISVDISNINLENKKNDKKNTKVDYWEKIELKQGMPIDASINDELMFKFDAPIKSALTHLLVDCKNHTYQILNASYTLDNDKKRYMNTNATPTAAKLITPNTAAYYSADTACYLKDLSIEDRLTTVTTTDAQTS
ncbi:surface-adhesin E family protein [Psychrobacter sp. I-STPA10]|uniref:surface-adhesin E family protein n=1 Tax=Psychrobacter sp. I-STPA10 TaxID=2585769 RepID=UPI001E47E935|nr:surface-adhesin E family protein [Psychrobacter sp. I-STPA10]